MLDKIVIFNLLPEKLKWLGLSSQVASNNIAHAEMPNATEKKVLSFKEALRKKEVVVDTGANINQEWQILELNKIVPEYQMHTTLYKQLFKLVRMVVGKGGNP